MSEKKLLDCPFCGGEARFSTEDGNWINCKSCGAETDYFEQREEAIKAWNTRVPMQKIVERLEEQQEESDRLYAIYFNAEDRGSYDAYSYAIEIVKEEGGLND
jgi:Lar family restriction alleviation protein